MNQTVKIFFTDMDDTLLNSEKQVTKENMDAISEALAAGHKIVFNTGRPLSGFLPILKELGLDREGCYAIAFNGGLIYDCAAQKTLHRRTIPLEYARVIFEKTQEAGLYCHLLRHLSSLPPCGRGNAYLHAGNPHSRCGGSASAGTPRQGAVQDDRD